MSVSKRLRYEILRRDDHRCRYCGECAPGTKLVVDHVLPVALGGKDVPENLVAACEPCNSGKSSSSPDAPLVANVADDALRWARAVSLAVKLRASQREGRDAYVDAFEDEWRSWTFADDRPAPLESGWRTTLIRFYDLDLPLDEVVDFVRVALTAYGVAAESRFRYFAACCWRAVEEIREDAQLLSRQYDEGGS